jgi:hypothetical protein
MQLLAKGLVTLQLPPKNSSADWNAEQVAIAAASLRASGRLRLRVRGESMLPALWPGDEVEIARCSVDEVRDGEIVLALREGRFFLHRFLARSGDAGFLLRGDSMPAPDPAFENAALLGRLVSRNSRAAPAHRPHHRQGRNAVQNPPTTRPFLPPSLCSRALGRVFCHCGPARRLALHLYANRPFARRARNRGIKLPSRAQFQPERRDVV